jgi:hypothetical protein
MQFKVKSGSSIEKGMHSGTILALDENERGEKKYKYIDIIIKVDGTDFEIKYGCPSPKGTINPKSKLGKLLKLWVNLEEAEKTGQDLNLETILLGKKISFMTIDKEGFAEVVEDSIEQAKA